MICYYTYGSRFSTFSIIFPYNTFLKIQVVKSILHILVPILVFCVILRIIDYFFKKTSLVFVMDSLLFFSLRRKLMGTIFLFYLSPLISSIIHHLTSKCLKCENYFCHFHPYFAQLFK